MENKIKNVFAQISMDETKMNTIRRELKTKKRIPMWMKAVACAILCLTVLLGIPATRTIIVHAAEKITNIFHTADGGEVIYTESDNGLSVTLSSCVGASYVRVVDDRIYMMVQNKATDVTEYCSENSYYRYELQNDDGSKSVLFIGGSIEKAGYVELLFDSRGKYIFNKMNVPTFEDGSVEAWVNLAMHAEGVPCGDIELDNMLERR